MSRIMPVVLALSLAACDHNTETQTGAAPASSDSTGTHQVAAARTGPPGVGGRSPDGTVNVDSMQTDSSRIRVDSTRTGAPQAAPQDTLGPRGVDSAANDTTTAR